jgi:hypothetical protein
MNPIAAIPVLTALVAAPAAGARADVVSAWNAVTLEAGRNQSLLMQARALAMAHAAMYDAANGVDRRFTPFLVDARPDGDVSGEAAVAASAHAVLAALYPDRRAVVDAALAASLGRIAAGPRRDAGVAFGDSIGGKVVRARQADGSGGSKPYTPTGEAGLWRPTLPGQLPALAPHWGGVSPFLLQQPARFVPGPPPSLQSDRYARDLAEVRELGGKASAARTADQTEAAVFWTGFAPYIWSSATRQAIARRPELSLVERARVFALMSGAIADAFVVAWMTKFKYQVWRPATAVHEAAADGNDATKPDPDWEPLIATPPFPCYVSAHAVTAGAAERVLAGALGGGGAPFTIVNAEVGISRSYRGFSQLAQEAVGARIWGGVHFRCSQVDGMKAGQAIGDECVRTRLTRLGAAPITIRHAR